MIELSALFLKACGIGLAISAPIGPIGLLCIRKTMHYGIRGALAVGFGASIAKMFYGILTGLGLTSISVVLLSHLWLVKLFGGMLLGYLGVKELIVQKSSKKSDNNLKSFTWLSTLFSTSALTLSNPMTIICFLGFISALAGESFSLQDSIIFSLGIFIGSMVWWLLLGSMISISRNYLPHHWVIRIQTASAGVLICFGLWSSIQGISALL